METENVQPKGRGTRPRGKRIDVWVNDNERAEISARAAQSGLSLSSYLKTAGLNQPIKSRADLVAVTDLVKVNADLGRVAGLLKLWLSEKRWQGAKPVDVEAMMNDFRLLQAEMRTVMAKVVK